MRRSRIFPQAFRECAVAALNGGVSAMTLSKALGIHYTTLHGWKRSADGLRDKRPRIKADILASGGALEAVFKDFISQHKGHILRMLEVQ